MFRDQMPVFLAASSADSNQPATLPSLSKAKTAFLFHPPMLWLCVKFFVPIRIILFAFRISIHSSHFFPLLWGTCPFKNCPLVGLYCGLSIGMCSSISFPFHFGKHHQYFPYIRKIFSYYCLLIIVRDIIVSLLDEPFHHIRHFC